MIGLPKVAEGSLKPVARCNICGLLLWTFRGEHTGWKEEYRTEDGRRHLKVRCNLATPEQWKAWEASPEHARLRAEREARRKAREQPKPRGPLTPARAAEILRRASRPGRCPSGDHRAEDCPTFQECKEAFAIFSSIAAGEKPRITLSEFEGGACDL